MSIAFEVLNTPVPSMFYDWYPYIKDENLVGECPLWKVHLNDALLNTAVGMKSVFITARDMEKNLYAGVLWLTFPAGYPQMVHFGWFYTVPEYRGIGIGRGIMDLCEKWERGNGVKIIMLPTNTKLMAYSGIYLKRGWKDTLVNTENGDAFMVKEYEEDFYDRYSAEEGIEEIDSVKYKDYVPFDYLVNRGESCSRLYPLDAVGGNRCISFEVDWDRINNIVLRKNGVFKGIAVLDIKCGRLVIDVTAYGDVNMRKTLNGALKKFIFSELLYAVVHKADVSKYRLFTDNGFAVSEYDSDFMVMRKF